jgi:hypothetical protein
MKAVKQQQQQQSTGGARTPDFPVDYSRSTSDVYQDTVKYFINRDRNLDILALLLTSRNDQSDADLPSWVPDWRVPASEVPISRHWDFISMKFAAGGLYGKAEPQREGERGVLRCKGFIVDGIDEALEYTTDVHELLSLMSLGGQRRFSLSGSDFDASKDRTRCFGTLLSHIPICLAPAGAKAGDQIAVFFGGKHPFVIRRRADTKTAEGAGTGSNREAQRRSVGVIQGEVNMGDGAGLTNVGEHLVYEMVGPCILPGAMFGEYLQGRDIDMPVTEFLLV